MAKGQKTNQADVNIGGNVDKSVIVDGNNNTVNVHYHAPDTVTRETGTRTGWFYGHRYGDLDSFTGRAAEMQMLDDWLANDTDNLLLITAFGGFGKSALTWQWFNHRVDKAKWQTAIWWSFYEKESGFESFLAETLAHLGVEVKASARMQLNDLLEALRGTNILIVLDGFERLLRQYGRMDAALQSDDEDAAIDPSQRDCSSPLTETFLRGLSGAGLKSKVLMTTRLCPRALESADGKLLKGCREKPLAAFSPDDAVTYFHNEGVKATRAEILALCATYGYHPLSLSLLVGLINADHEQRGDIEAARTLEIFDDVKARRHHVLERAYGSLAPERRDLLSKMSCFRGSMEYGTIKKVFASKPSGNFLTKLFKSHAYNGFDLDKALLDLRKRGLLQYAGETQRYDMHPIVRHYAYDHFTDEKQRKEAHLQLVKHFRREVSANKNVKALEDLSPIIELYYQMVRAGTLDDAWLLLGGQVWNAIYFQFGSYQLLTELVRAVFLDGEDKLARLKYKHYQASAFFRLAICYYKIGQPRRAITFFEMHNNITFQQRDKLMLAKGLSNMAFTSQLPVGALSIAEHNLRRSIDLCREVGKEISEGPGQMRYKAIGHIYLGHALSLRGAWWESEQELDTGLKILEKLSQIQTQGVTWSYRAFRLLLLGRDNPKSKIENLKSAIESAQRAVELADETTRTEINIPRDYVDAYWLLGAAYRVNNELTLAEENLSKALNLCRQINNVETEADILLDVARLRYAQGDFKDALEKASEALAITERSGYVLQGADVNLFLAELAMAGITNEGLGISDPQAVAKRHAETALKLAYCDGGEYKYKVAYEEAERMLEKLK